MPTAALLLVLGAAVLHATWNALSKQARHPLALVVFDEWPSPLGALGVGLVVVGIVALHLASASPLAPAWP